MPAEEAIVLVGGLGTRLRPVVSDVPKPLAPHKAGPAMEILLLGACELLILKGAAHAAVDAANNLAAADNKAVHFKSLINRFESLIHTLRKLCQSGHDVIVGDLLLRHISGISPNEKHPASSEVFFVQAVYTTFYQQLQLLWRFFEWVLGSFRTFHQLFRQQRSHSLRQLVP